MAFLIVMSFKVSDNSFYFMIEIVLKPGLYTIGLECQDYLDSTKESVQRIS